VRVAAEPVPFRRYPAAARVSRGTRATRIAAQIESDALRGKLPGSAVVPSVKQLQARFGCSYHTVRKALDLLGDSGALGEGPGGRRFHPSSLQSPSSTLLFVSWMPGDVFLSTVERETARAGASLRVLPLFPRDTLLSTLRDIGRTPGRSTVVGSVVSLTGGFPSQYREILSLLLPLGRPVAVLDATGGATDTGIASSPHLRIFTQARFREPGAAVGRFLLGLGHRRVAYVCPIHRSNWSQQRLEGLSDVYGKAGHAGGVTAFVASAEQRELERGFYGAELGRMIARLAAGKGPYRRQLADALQSMAGGVAFEAEWRWLAERQVPLMQRALASGSTAWVAGNDRVALIALEYLASRGIRVPAELSVVGFDDLPSAYTAGLTSYNHNSQDAVQAALNHVFSARRGAPRAIDSGPITIEGYISVRNTTSALR
jgi:hypothetical protein